MTRDHFHSDELEVPGLGLDCTTHLVVTCFAELGLVVAVMESKGLGKPPRSKTSKVRSLVQGQRRWRAVPSRLTGPFSADCGV